MRASAADDGSEAAPLIDSSADMQATEVVK
jgi:hypothetical protein